MPHLQPVRVPVLLRLIILIVSGRNIVPDRKCPATYKKYNRLATRYHAENYT